MEQELLKLLEESILRLGDDLNMMPTQRSRMKKAIHNAYDMGADSVKTKNKALLPQEEQNILKKYR